MDTWNWLKVTVNTLSWFPQNIYAVFNIVFNIDNNKKKCYSSRILEIVLNSCVYFFMQAIKIVFVVSQTSTRTWEGEQGFFSKAHSLC